jgi:hypothetical protein
MMQQEASIDDFRNKYLTKDENKEIDNFEKLYNINFFEAKKAELTTLIEKNRGEVLLSALSPFVFENELEMLELRDLYEKYQNNFSNKQPKDIVNSDYLNFKALCTPEDVVFLHKLEIIGINLYKVDKDSVSNKKVSQDKIILQLRTQMPNFSLKTADNFYNISSCYLNFLNGQDLYPDEPRDIKRKSTFDVIDLG